MLPVSLAIFFHRIGPYHFARLRAAGRLLKVTAMEMSNKDNTYAWEKVEGSDSFKRITLFDEDSRTQPASEIIRCVHAALDMCKPDAVVVNGWADTEAFAAYQWCLKKNIPAVVMSESTEWDEHRVAWKEWIKRRIVRFCSAGLVGGAPHADYLVKLGMPHDHVFMGYDAIDNDHFSVGADRVRADSQAARTKYKLPDRYFLASARFVEKKNLSRLIEAYARYRTLCSLLHAQTAPCSLPSVSAFDPESGSLLKSLPAPCCDSAPWSLLLLGDGPLKSTINVQLSTLNLHDYVQLPGFVQYPELPTYYGLAGAFIHASTTEQWGLVVNEAMASGLPVLVSNRCGCAQDLVHEGVNGFTFDPCDVEQLGHLMLKISGGAPSSPLPAPDSLPLAPCSNRSLLPAQTAPCSDSPISASQHFSVSAFKEAPCSSPSLSAFGSASQKIISSWGPDRFATGLKSAVTAALSVPRPKATLLDRVLLNLLLHRRPRADN